MWEITKAKLLEDCGLGTKNDPDHKPSPEVVSSRAFPPFQPTKPSTRSSSQPKHTAENPVELTTTSQKKRKRNTTRIGNIDWSFSGQTHSFGSTSSRIFPCESDEETQDQVPSKEALFSGPSAAMQKRTTVLQSLMLTDPESSGGEISRRCSKRGKVKRT
jgi:hypothetical protein